MVRDSGIPATKPVFPSYLLPGFSLIFSRRHSASSSSDSSAASSEITTPSNSPPAHYAPAAFAQKPNSSRSSRLSRTAPDTLRCASCSSDVAFASQIISKGFTGRYGRAFLVGPPAPPAEPCLLNVRVGRSESRQLVTGWHVVADICCGTCTRKLGWKYVDAKEQSQKYKVGKFILETERVVTHRSWADVPVSESDCVFEGINDARDKDAGEEEIVFDSDDDDECEDIFAGVWNAETVARRRSRSVAGRKSSSAVAEE